MEIEAGMEAGPESALADSRRDSHHSTASPLRVLVISDLYPAPPWPAAGIFVERQTAKVSRGCETVTVVVPTRPIPPLRLLRTLVRPRVFIEQIRQWQRNLLAVPPEALSEAGRTIYPRYFSLPRPVFHGTWGFLAYAQMRRLLRDLNRQVGYNIIHAHFASPAGVVALLARRWMKVPVVISVHGAEITYTERQWPIGHATVRWVLRNADATLVNSTWTRRRVEALGAPGERIRLVRLGAEPPLPPTSRPSRGPEFVLLTIGHLTKRKGQAFVLRAIKSLLDRGYSLRYTVVGSGEEGSSLRALAAELGIEKAVSFEGDQPHSRIWEYLGTSDAFVLPSWNEAFGVAYIEAMSMGVPAIGCVGEGGPQDLRALGDCIELVPPREVESLARALADLIDDPARRAHLAAEGRRVAGTYFTWEKTADETLAVYRELVGWRSRA